MADNVVYKWDGYSERFGCRYVKEFRGATATFVFRAYIRGNKVTLYPHQPLHTTDFKRDKIVLSIFDIKQ